MGYPIPMKLHCRNCIYHQLNEHGRFSCSKGHAVCTPIKNGKPCPDYHYPHKDKWTFKNGIYAYYCVEVEYWNAVFEEINYAVFVLMYELPYMEADTDRKADHTIRLQSRDYLNFFEVREEAIRTYESQIKPSDGLAMAKKA